MSDEFKKITTDIGVIEYRGNVDLSGPITLNKGGELRLSGKNQFEGFVYTGKDNFLSEETEISGSKIKLIDDKIHDLFKGCHACNYPFTRVESEKTLRIDGTLSVDDMKAIINIFEETKQECL